MCVDLGGEADGADDEQGTVQHEHGCARGEAGAVPGHRDAFHGQPQSETSADTRTPKHRVCNTVPGFV